MNEEPTSIQCGEHGDAAPTFVCGHLCRHPVQRWFCDVPPPDTPYPDAWCASCNAELMQMDAAHLKTEDTECLEQIINAAERAAGLTRQLLAFSRKQIMQPKPLDLNEALANLTKMLHRIIGEHIHLVTVPSAIRKPFSVASSLVFVEISRSVRTIVPGAALSKTRACGIGVLSSISVNALRKSVTRISVARHSAIGPKLATYQRNAELTWLKAPTATMSWPKVSPPEK